MKKQTHYAGFWIRAVADFIDSIILDVAAGLVTLILLGVVFWIKILLHSPESMGSSFFESLDPILLQIIFFGFRGAFSLGYYSWGTYRYGTTVGKKLFHIYVISTSKRGQLTLLQSVIRCFAYLVSYLPLGAGFLMAAFHPEKRALHDLIAETVSVIRKDK